MSAYDEIFNLRKNKFGETVQERTKGLRERDFELHLAKSQYRCSFVDGTTTYTAVLAPFKQDVTQSLSRLLTRNSDVFYGGYTFEYDGLQYMILYKEDNISRGYTAYVVIKLTIEISWIDKTEVEHTSWAYLFGPMRNAITDSIKSGSIGSANAVWKEAFKINHLIMPTNHNLSKDDYIILNTTSYLVTGYDWDSVPGVMFVSLDETYEKDLTSAPAIVAPATSEDEDNYWFNLR